MKTETLRMFSGFRIHLAPEAERPKLWAKLADEIGQGPYLEIMATIMDEPYYVDDMMRELSAGQLLSHAIEQGEFLAHFLGDEPVGVSILRDIVAGRDATLEAWVFPKFRGSYCVFNAARQLIKYAFSAFEAGGLQLRKIKAQVSANNPSAIKAVDRLGFKLVGISPADGLFTGQYTDMLLLELPSPVYFSLGTNNGQQEVESSAATDVPSAGTVSSASGVLDASASADDDTAGTDSAGVDRDRKPNRGVRKRGASTRSKPANKSKSKRSSTNRSR